MITPCIKVCEIQGGICKGCGRSLQQIREWSLYTYEERLQIMRDLELIPEHYRIAAELRRLEEEHEADSSIAKYERIKSAEIKSDDQ